jgi:hypothetical protein
MTGAVGNKKPTAVASRGFLSKAFLTSTSPNGVANYDDDQGYLSNYSKHCEPKIRVGAEWVKPAFRHLRLEAKPCLLVNRDSVGQSE